MLFRLCPFEMWLWQECVELARSLGKQVGEELKLPVFLYAEAALRQSNRNLADIRRGGYDGLKQRLGNDDGLGADHGPGNVGKAGGCIIGARGPLIAFNVFLNTADIDVAKAIARKIRTSSGGLPHVMALGLRIRGLAQVSMNLTNYRVTSISDVLGAIRREATLFDVDIYCAEIIGLLPRDALSAREADAFQVINFGPDRILEFRLAEHGRRTD